MGIQSLGGEVDSARLNKRRRGRGCVYRADQRLMALLEIAGGEVKLATHDGR